MFLTIYKPEGIHTKDNLCNCGYCKVWPEFFHAHEYYTCIVYNFEQGIELARELRAKKYPDGIILFTSKDVNGGNYAIRENGTKLIYNKQKHQWFNEDGTSHSLK